MTTKTTAGPSRAASARKPWVGRSGKCLALALVTGLVAFTGSPYAGVAAATTSSVVISEVHPSGSGNGTYAADWFEVTNTGTTAVDITGWKMDDNSNSFANAVALNGVTSIRAGRSVVFIETHDRRPIFAAFPTAWFGATPPRGSQSAPTVVPASA